MTMLEGEHEEAATPGLLQRTEAGRTEGLDAFEGRMVGMGVMEADARDALVGRGGNHFANPTRDLGRT